MKKLIKCLALILYMSLVAPASEAQESTIWLSGRVKDAVWNTDLTGAMVYMYDVNGALLDSIKADKGSTIKDGEVVDLAFFGFNVPRKDATYTFDISCPGYNDKTITYTLAKIKRNERFREIPVAFLEKAPHKLGEVTVTASKIKFYNKGDTLVYNASAFQLAEGSMLDALISQLPGAQLDENGQITVNGEFVESLLLNGKKFFDGNNQLMLENIAAYTVKSVEVYRGQTREEKWMDDPLAEKHLTMDVKLKKEYMTGVILNAQGGYGSDDRYMGRLFASMFTPTLNLSLVGNINNLNDNRKPGKNDTWTPEMMPSGTKIYKMAGFNYDYTSRDDKKHADGHVTLEETINNNRTTTTRTNFLTGGNTFENAFSGSRSSNLKLETRNRASINTDKVMWWGMMVGRYIKKDNRTSSLSASFREEQSDVTREALESLYSDASPERLDAVINRSVTRSDASSHEGEFQFFPTLMYKIVNNDRVDVQFGIRYKDAKEEVWRDYNINYGADPVPAVQKRQYFDNSPNRRLTLEGSASFNKLIKSFSVGLSYGFKFENTDKDSYMYALDRLADMGIYGTVPSGYLASFDPSNSYTSRLIQNKHSLQPNINWYARPSEGTMLQLRLRPEITFEHSHFDYWRDGRSYLVSRSSRMVTTKNMDASVRFSQGLLVDKRRPKYRHAVEYQFNVNTKTPDMLHMIDVINDADPLNISSGNPDLRNEYQLKHTLSWLYKPHSRMLNNRLTLSYQNTSNALVRGYTYDTTTGVRHNRTYNVDGNNSFDAGNNFMIQFGPKQQFSLDLPTSAGVMNYADMIGVDMSEPVQSKVRNTVLSQGMKFAWQIGSQTLEVNGRALTRRTTSTREDFNDFNARHFNYGVIGRFVLPGGFGVNTDFTFYTRRGYGVSYLDTTDAIWNVRLTYTPRGGRWVFMADGFDLLHQLSNVNYAVNASGRTVSYTNALPRYVMFSVQYRLNIQPKKR